MHTDPNPLLELGPELPFDRIQARHVEPAIDILLTRAREELAVLAADDAPAPAPTTTLVPEEPVPAPEITAPEGTVNGEEDPRPPAPSRLPTCRRT